MKLVCARANSRECNDIAAEFVIQKAQGRIMPRVVRNIIPRFDNVVTAFDGNDIAGIATYNFWTPKNKSGFEMEFRFTANWPVFDSQGYLIDDIEFDSISCLEGYDFSKPFAHITRIESFKPGRGVGRAMLGYLSEEENFGAAMLQAIRNTAGFYVKSGFVDSGFRACYPENPIMIMRARER